MQQIKLDAQPFYRLLRVLAVALRIEPLLLRNARQQFCSGSDIEIESEIWFSSIMHSRNAKACVLRGGIARLLVDDLADVQQNYIDAWEYVRSHTSHWSSQDKLEQELRLAARQQDSVTLRDGFNQILKTLQNTSDAGTKRDLSRWIKGAMPGLLSNDETSETAHLLFQYTAAALGLPATWSENKEQQKASMPQWLIDALPPLQESRIGIQLRRGLLECVEPDVTQHQIKVKLPLPTPVLLKTSKGDEAKWESLWIGKKIRIPQALKWLTLQTLDGQLYRFTIKQTTPGEDKTDDASRLQLLYMSEDIAQAYQIAELLRRQGIELDLMSDQVQQENRLEFENRPVLRLWSQASARYWQKLMPNSDETGETDLSQGLLLRTDPKVALPVGLNPVQAIDLTDWNMPENSEQLGLLVRNWLSSGELNSPEATKTQPSHQDVPITDLQLNEFANWLIKDKVLAEGDVKIYLQNAQKERIPLISYLVANQLVDSKTIASKASVYFGVPFFDLDALDYRSMPANLVNENLIRKYHALPLFIRGKTLFIGLSDPTNFEALDDINQQTRLNTKIVLVEENKLLGTIEAALKAVETPIPFTIEALLKELENPETKPRRRLEIGDKLAEIGDPRQGVGVKEYELNNDEEDVHLNEYIEELHRLVLELREIKTVPPRRLEIGNRMAELGDLRPGTGLNDNGLPDIDWVEISEGPFIFGEDKKQQTINLSRYYISRYPVTNSQFQAFIDAGGYHDQRWWVDLIKPEPEEPAWKQPNRPRETVDWYEALAFTRWLSAQLDFAITLPTEQQWEKAARGTDGREYPWGNEYLSGYANINEANVKTGSYYLKETSAVGIYPQGKSLYQVDDMAGNVWEWCLNKYDLPEHIAADQSGNLRVLRGGSWFDVPDDARASNRSRDTPGSRYYLIGFRVVCLSPYTDL